MTIPQFNQLPNASATQSPLNECDGTLWVISPKAATNLCTNPSFETDTNNWTASAGSTFIRVNTPWAGAYAASWGTTTGVYLQYGTTTPFKVDSNGYWAISFYCYSTSNNVTSTSAITVEMINVAGTVIAKTIQPITTTWARVVLNVYSAAIAGDSYKIRLSVNQTITVVIDAVQIEQVAQNTSTTAYAINLATTYFDGSTVGTVSNSQITSPQYTWLGKAHASVSTRSIGAANGGTPINLQNNLGFTVVGVIGADNPVPNNQIVNYNATDGATLQDILIPPRQITFVGRISSTDKVSLARKVSTFLEYFGRDTTAIRQPKYFIFQFKNGRENVGQPMYFSGVVMNTANVPLSNDLAYTVSITLNMIDPFFYGHTESGAFSQTNLRRSPMSLSYIPDFTQTTQSITAYTQFGIDTAGGSIKAIAIAPDGSMFLGGDFTSVGGGLPNTAYVVKYVPGTVPGTYTVVTMATTAINALNGSVSALAITPDGADLWIGGAFTTANGVASNYIVRYTIATGVWSTYGAGAGGGVNFSVYAIAIKSKRLASSGGGYPYDVYIGGGFNAANGVAMYRMAHTSQTANTWLAFGTGNGMNGDVYALAYNNNLDRLYIGGSFTTSQGGVANAFTGICYVNIAAIGTTVAFYTGVNVAAGGYVYSIYTNDVDNSLYIGGSFTATFAGSALLRAASFNGVVWNQVDVGFSNGIVYEIVPYNNGFAFIGTFTSGGGYTGLYNGIAWYNGQSLIPMPVSSLDKGFFTGAVTGNNYLYLALVYDGSNVIASGSVVPLVNDATAASALIYQIYHNDTAVYDFVVNSVQNLTQQTNISLRQLPITYKEIVQINTNTGTIISDIMGNQLRYILGSGITNQKIMPGNNYILAWYVTSTSPIVINIVVFWRKAYNALFDGVNAT
jgi:hypothetical protein